MKKFYWAFEVSGEMTMRDQHGTPFVYLQRNFVTEEGGFMVTILQPGLPISGPYKNRERAAEWAQEYIARELFPDAAFGPVPQPGIRKAS